MRIYFLDQVRIHKFLEKTKKKKKKKNTSDKKCEVECESIVIEPDVTTKEQERLRKKVTQLLKKQKLKQVREIVRKDDDSKPWDQEAHAKVSDIICFEWSLFSSSSFWCFV